MNKKVIILLLVLWFIIAAALCFAGFDYSQNQPGKFDYDTQFFLHRLLTPDDTNGFEVLKLKIEALHRSDYNRDYTVNMLDFAVFSKIHDTNNLADFIADYKLLNPEPVKLNTKPFVPEEHVYGLDFNDINQVNIYFEHMLSK